METYSPVLWITIEGCSESFRVVIGKDEVSLLVSNGTSNCPVRHGRERFFSQLRAAQKFPRPAHCRWNWEGFAYVFYRFKKEDPMETLAQAIEKTFVLAHGKSTRMGSPLNGKSHHCPESEPLPHNPVTSRLGLMMSISTGIRLKPGIGLK